MKEKLEVIGYEYTEGAYIRYMSGGRLFNLIRLYEELEVVELRLGLNQLKYNEIRALHSMINKTHVTVDNQATMTGCSSCRTLLFYNYTFCPNCGKEIIWKGDMK